MQAGPDTPAQSPHFAWFAAAFEAAIGVLAIALGWLFDFQPLRLIDATPVGFSAGLAASLLPLALVGLMVRFPVGPVKQLVAIIDEMVVPTFRSCNLIDLAGIALLAGLGEELLFRGLLQQGLAHAIGGVAGLWIGLLLASTLFGLLHWVTATYALLAGMIGLYFGALWLVSGNLLLPIIAHAAYDFVILAYLLYFRTPPEAPQQSED